MEKKKPPGIDGETDDDAYQYDIAAHWICFILATQKIIPPFPRKLLDRRLPIL
jgi:hypothetical protein